MFKILTHTLPEEYSTVIDILDESSMPVTEKIARLESKEAKLKKEKESANSAKGLRSKLRR